jgi:hypothetical protein
MQDTWTGDPTNSLDMKSQAATAAEGPNDPLAWARVIVSEEACKRFAERAEARERRAWRRISRISGGAW